MRHEHCWHAFRGPLLMVVPDGHIVQKCCSCKATRTIHVDHIGTPQRRGRFSIYPHEAP